LAHPDSGMRPLCNTSNNNNINNNNNITDESKYPHTGWISGVVVRASDL